MKSLHFTHAQIFIEIFMRKRYILLSVWRHKFFISITAIQKFFICWNCISLCIRLIFFVCFDSDVIFLENFFLILKSFLWRRKKIWRKVEWERQEHIDLTKWIFIIDKSIFFKHVCWIFKTKWRRGEVRKFIEEYYTHTHKHTLTRQEMLKIFKVFF